MTKNIQQKLLAISCVFIAACSSPTPEKKLSVKGYEIGQTIESCPSKISYTQTTNEGITKCFLNPSSYAGYEMFSYSIEIYEGKIFSVRVEINDVSSHTPIINALTQVYGKSNEDGARYLKWTTHKDSLFVFNNGNFVDIRLVNHDLQEKQRQDLAKNKVKDL